MVLCVELGEGDGSVGDVLSELVEGGLSVWVVEAWSVRVVRAEPDSGRPL